MEVRRSSALSATKAVTDVSIKAKSTILSTACPVQTPTRSDSTTLTTVSTLATKASSQRPRCSSSPSSSATFATSLVLDVGAKRLTAPAVIKTLSTKIFGRTSASQPVLMAQQVSQVCVFPARLLAKPALEPRTFVWTATAFKAKVYC